LLENVVGLLQNGYKHNHSISEMAERVGIVYIIGVLEILFYTYYIGFIVFYFFKREY
jgi:hypothetical protein